MSVNSLALEAVSNRAGVPVPPGRDDVLASLTKYIPTESVTLYVAVVSAQGALAQYGITSRFAYWLFVALTPCLLLLLFLRQLAVGDSDWKVPVGKWPWWRIAASTIAFAVWALAVPGNPIIPPDDASGGIVAALLATFVSMFLSMLAPFFERNNKSS